MKIKMKSIILSVVVVGALAIAGVGGTLADFSDSEEEVGDALQAGSLDLLVNDLNEEDFLPMTIRYLVPDKSYHFQKTVRNVGTIDGWLYIHFKNVVCIETNDKDLNGDGVIDELDKPEPEIVAEFGGKHGQEMVPGLGERCDMEEHIMVELFLGQPGTMMEKMDLVAAGYDENGDGWIRLSELECQQVLIGPLPACGEEWLIRFGFKIKDVPEEYYGLDIFDETDPHEVKWNWWPTNCYQGDTVMFDIMFELLQTDYEPPGN